MDPTTGNTTIGAQLVSFGIRVQPEFVYFLVPPRYLGALKATILAVLFVAPAGSSFMVRRIMF